MIRIRSAGILALPAAQTVGDYRRAGRQDGSRCMIDTCPRRARKEASVVDGFGRFRHWTTAGEVRLGGHVTADHRRPQGPGTGAGRGSPGGVRHGSGMRSCSPASSASAPVSAAVGRLGTGARPSPTWRTATTSAASTRAWLTRWPANMQAAGGELRDRIRPWYIRAWPAAAPHVERQRSCRRTRAPGHGPQDQRRAVPAERPRGAAERRRRPAPTRRCVPLHPGTPYAAGNLQ